MTLGQILTAIKSNTKRSDKDTEARTGVQLACQRIAAVHRFRTGQVTTDLTMSAGNSFVALPGDFESIVEARWLTDLTSTQSWPILIKTKPYIVDRIPNGDSVNASYPYIGYVEMSIQRLVLYPGAAVDGIVRLSYNNVQSLDAFGDDSNSHPLHFVDEVLICYGTAWVLNSIQLFQEAANWMQRGDQALLLSTKVDDNDNEVFAMDVSGIDRADKKTFIDPYLDPFAGLRRGWGSFWRS